MLLPYTRAKNESAQSTICALAFLYPQLFCTSQKLREGCVKQTTLNPQFDNSPRVRMIDGRWEVVIFHCERLL